MSENKSIEIENERYEGEFLHDMFHGQGTFYFANGDVYVGQWVENKRSGRGIMYFEDGDRYEGDFLNDKFNGKGTYFFKTGVKRAGVWRNDKLVSSQQNSASASAGFHTNSSGQISPNFFSTGRRAVFVSSPTNEAKSYVHPETNITEISQSVSSSGAVLNKDHLVREVLMSGLDTEQKDKCLTDVAEVREVEAQRRRSSASPKASPTATPKASPKPSPRASPKPSPKASPKSSPRASPTLLEVLANLSKPSPKASPKSSPRASPGLELTSVEVTYEQYGAVEDKHSSVHHVESLSSSGDVRQSTTYVTPTISQFTPATQQEPSLKSVFETNSKIESFSEQINSTSSLSTLLNAGNTHTSSNVEVVSNRGDRRCSQIIDEDDTNLDGFSTLADKKRCRELTQQRKTETKTEIRKSIFSEKPKSPVRIEKPKTPVPSRTVSDIISVLSRDPEPVVPTRTGSDIISVFSRDPEPVVPTRTAPAPALSPSGPSSQILRDLLVMAGSGSVTGTVKSPASPRVSVIRIPTPRVSTPPAAVEEINPAAQLVSDLISMASKATTVNTRVSLSPPAIKFPSPQPAASQLSRSSSLVSTRRVKLDNGDSYEGSVRSGRFNGRGTYFYGNGDKYVGDFVDNIKSGNGTLIFSDDDVYEGQFRDNKFNGQGTYKYKDGSSYTGEWKDNKKSGSGVLEFADGDRYEGQFKHDKFNGDGTYVTSDGKVTSGNWVDNEYRPNTRRSSLRASAVDEIIESIKSSRRSEQTLSDRKSSRRSTRLDYSTPLEKVDEPECICQPCYTNPCCPYETITEHFTLPAYSQACLPQVSYNPQPLQCQPPQCQPQQCQPPQCQPPQFQQPQQVVPPVQCPPGCVPEPVRCPPGCEPDPNYNQQQQQFFQSMNQQRSY